MCRKRGRAHCCSWTANKLPCYNKAVTLQVISCIDMEMEKRKRAESDADARGGSKTARLGEELISTSYAGATRAEGDSVDRGRRGPVPVCFEGSQ